MAGLYNYLSLPQGSNSGQNTIYSAFLTILTSLHLNNQNSNYMSIKTKFLIFFLLITSASLACKPNTKTRIYDCKGENSLTQEIAQNANKEVEERMKNCKDCCIKKTSNEIAEKYGCKVEIIEPK